MFPHSGSIWELRLGGRIVSSPTVADGILYIGSRDSSLYAIDVATGTLRWKRKTLGWIDSSPLVRDGLVVVGSRDGNIWIFDARNGDLTSKMCGGLQLSSPLALGNGTILSGMGPPANGLGGFAWGNPEPHWKATFPAFTYSSPATDGSLALIGANNGTLYAIDLASRQTAWTIETPGQVYLSTPAVDQGIAYFAPGNYGALVYAIGLSKGNLVWKSFGRPQHNLSKRLRLERGDIHPKNFLELLRLRPDHRLQVLERMKQNKIRLPKVFASKGQKDSLAFFPYGDRKTSSVAVGSKNLFVIHKELGYPKPRFGISALNKGNGTGEWFFAEMRDAPRLGYCSSPVVANNKVFFGWGEGKVYALNTSTGKKEWEDSLGGHVVSSPAISDGKIYFATYNGTVYAYDLLATEDPTGFKEGTYAYPNPAKTVSRLQYFMEKSGSVEARIYDAGERLVKVFRESGIAAGSKNAFSWDVRSAANALYYAIVEVRYEDGSTQQKIVKIAVLK